MGNHEHEFGYLLETLCILSYVWYTGIMRQKARGADNQQESPPLEWSDSSETIRRAPPSSTVLQAYLHGARHDGTWNRANNRIRFAQKGTEWLKVLQAILHRLGCSSWIYREGKTRSVYVLETKAKFLYSVLTPTSIQRKNEKIAYIRGFFDAEGGIPQKPTARFYIQLVQSDRDKLIGIKQLLKSLDIAVGKIHQPSRRVDPRYWRMFVRAQSYKQFIRLIGTWHPRKIAVLRRRVKI